MKSISKKLLSFLIILCVAFLGLGSFIVNAEATPTEGDKTYQFKDMSNFSSWDASYSTRTHDFECGTVTLEAANKNSQTITDIPVTKGKSVTFVLNSTYKDYCITGFTFTCRQWGSKAQTITAHYSNNGGTSYTAISGTSATFEITKTLTTVQAANAIKFTFSSSSNQVGLVSLSVTITKKPNVLVTGVTIDETLEVQLTEEIKLNPVVAPENASNKNVSYVSSDPTVASVDENGVVKGLKKGNTTITVTTEDQSKTDTCAVTVVDLTHGTLIATPKGDKTAATVDITGTQPGGVTATYVQTYNQTNSAFNKIYQGDSATLVVSGLTEKHISGITLNMASNSSSGTGTLSITDTTNTYATLSATTFNNWYSNTDYSPISIGVKVTLNSATINADGDITIVITTTANSLFFYSAEITWEPKSVVPEAIISSTKTTTNVGTDLQFNYSTKNIDSVTNVVWTSSNPDAATISQSGVLTPVAMGTTKVKATVNGTVVSNEISINVYPNNTNNVTIVEALAIAEFTGKTATPLAYTTVANISDVNGNNVTITDGTNTIVAYKSSNGFTASDVGKKVEVVGSLINYNLTTKEFQAKTIKLFYTVTYNSDGGSEVTPDEVTSGSKLTAPADPSKTDFTFDCWMNGNSKWDFANDTVTENITLKAKWINNALLTFKDDLDDIKAYMALAYTYLPVKNTEKVTDVITYDLTKFTGTNYKNWTIVSKNKQTYFGNTAFGNDAFQMRSNNNSGIIISPNSGKVSKITVNWYTNTTAGRSVKIYGSNTAYTATSDLFDSTKRGTQVTTLAFNDKDASNNTTFTVETSYAYYGIQASGSLYINSITVEYEDTLLYTDVNFKLKCAVDKELVQLVTNAPGTSKEYGIQISTDTKTKKYASTNQYFTVEEGVDGKLYVILELGDVLNNLDRLEQEFTVQAYATIDGDTYVSASEKTYSVLSIVKQYKSISETGVDNLVKLLTSFGYDFSK